MEFEELRRIIAEKLDIEEETITENSRFTEDLGADSLDIYQIIMGVEDELGIELDTDQAERVITVRDAVEIIQNTRG